MGPLVEFFVFKSSRKEKKWPAYRQKKPKMADDWRGGRLKKKNRHLSAKVSYFFISQEKFIFDHFSAKIEWVSENGVFFFRCCFFFSALWKWVSEWSVNFSRKKKNNLKKKTFLEKKKTTQKCEKPFFLRFLTYFDLFLGTSTFLASEWACKLFLGK